MWFRCRVGEVEIKSNQAVGNLYGVKLNERVVKCKVK